MKEISCGGVVTLNDTILLLKKFNGIWVLPKGHVEENESFEETAIREVREETGVIATIDSYLGKIEYSFYINQYKKINKEVHFFHMFPLKLDLKPLYEEGFAQVEMMNYEETLYSLAYKSEKDMVYKAFKNKKAE